jgi:hypothetical protein
MAKKILYNTIGGKRPVEKPKKRWTEAVDEDSKKTWCKEIGKEKQWTDKSGDVTFRRPRSNIGLLSRKRRRGRKIGKLLRMLKISHFVIGLHNLVKIWLVSDILSK